MSRSTAAPAPHIGFRTIGNHDITEYFLRTSLITPRETEFPWLREAYNAMRRTQVKITSQAGAESTISADCGPNGCSVSRFNIGRDHSDLTSVLAHELAHVYTMGNEYGDEPAEYVGAGWVYMSELTKGGTNCPVEEIYASVMAFVIKTHTIGYTTNCSKTPRRTVRCHAGHRQRGRQRNISRLVQRPL